MPPQKPQTLPPPRSGRKIVIILFAGAVAVALWLMASGRGVAHGWRIIEGQLQIRWAETRTDHAIEPPLAPAWIRSLHARGIAWPTDQPVVPPGASFAADGNLHTVAWYVIRSLQPSNELWHVEKDTVKLHDDTGKDLPWPGGTGSVLIDGDRNLQYLYLGVPANEGGKRGYVRFRLSRFGGTRTDEVALPF